MNMPRKNLLEWAVFGLSALLVAAVLVFLAYDGARGEQRPAQIRVELGAPEPRGDRLVLPVTLVNGGELSAELVTVAIVVRRDGQEDERATLTLDLLPGGSRREASVSLVGSAPPLSVEASVVSYLRP
jgi:uncharacterized protein (TIGR02588 family)